MKKGINLFIVLFIGLVPFSAYADPISIDVPSTCTVTDADSVQHAFPQNDSPSSYLGVCMLEAAKEAGLVTFTLTNDPNFGLYVQSVNGVAPGPTEYWALWSNGSLASCGIGCIPLSQDDTLGLILTDWMTNVESTTVTLRVHSLIASPPSPSRSGGDSNVEEAWHTPFELVAAREYLESHQNRDGSFSVPFLSDWAALALVADDATWSKNKLSTYFLSASSTLRGVLDFERHAMALEALGINPYSGTSVDTITPIVQAFDGMQIGDVSLDNDDIFALFPLLAAGYTTNDALIATTTVFILSRQGTDGSWDASVDMTAAAVQALSKVRSLPGVPEALARAETFLRSMQQRDGGFTNSFATSWVLQSISALGSTPSDWKRGILTPREFLSTLQQSDGGLELPSATTVTRVWATAYAIPAMLGKSWPALLQTFPKHNATSTVAVSTVLPAAAPVLKQHRVSKLPFPALVDQTAAVANAPTGTLFSHIWSAIASFFGNVL